EQQGQRRRKYVKKPLRNGHFKIFECGRRLSFSGGSGIFQEEIQAEFQRVGVKGNRKDINYPIFYTFSYNILIDIMGDQKERNIAKTKFINRLFQAQPMKTFGVGNAQNKRVFNCLSL